MYGMNDRVQINYRKLSTDWPECSGKGSIALICKPMTIWTQLLPQFAEIHFEF